MSASESPFPERLYLIQLSTAIIPLPSGPFEAMSCCYLVQMSDGKHILIDTGLPADYVAPAGTPPSESKTDVIEQLARIGLQPDQINILICTHFDPDHAGYNDSFPNAELIVQRQHYEIARGGHPRYDSIRPHWDHPALHYRLIDGDTELFPGLSVIETSGHAPGHQSVLIRLPKTGAVLLAIDAVLFARLFTPDRPAAPMDDNLDQLRASTVKLIDLAEKEHAALVIFGHDGPQWKTLRKAPEYYD